MKIFLVLSILLMSCGTEESFEPDGCIVNPEVEQISSEKICLNSMRCSQKGEISFANYMCVCDSICLCFYSHLSDCGSVYGECTSNSSMLLMPDDFCSYPDKDMILKELYNSAQEVINL